MKKLLTILLILLSLNSFAQLNDNKINWKRIGLYSLASITDGIGDALNDEGKKDWGHTVNALSLGIHLYMTFDKDTRFEDFRDFAIGAIIYTGLRYALFDITYNLTRGLPYNYVGNTSFYDQLIRDQGNMIVFSKAIVFTFVISLDKNEFPEFNK